MFVLEGPYCEYVATSSSKLPEEYTTFDAYFATLELTCVDEGEASVFTWTPDASTPDDLYYQVSRRM